MLPTPTPQPSESQPAERVFAAYLARLELGERPDFEELCRQHPSEADALRRLLASLPRVRELLGQAGFASPATGGAGDGARVARESEDSSSRVSADVIQRLAGRSAASGRYRVEQEIARGGMGQVLRVWDEDLRRFLAMKRILGSKLSQAGSATPLVPTRSLARFLDEAQVAAQLDHPGIVPVHELGLDGDGRVYFTMKLVEGRTLEEVCEELARGEGGWTQTRIVGLIQRVCEAMAYAHSKGVIHRDLKPRNVMVGGFGAVYVMDWGLAKVVQRDGEREGDSAAARVDTDRTAREAEDGSNISLSETGSGLGTPGYMAPEQRMGRWSEVGPHSDVYSVGGMLARLLTGQRPADEPRPVSQAAPDAPAELAAICDKAMARDWHARYRDMSELSEDLASYIEDRVVRAYPTGPWLEARKWVRRNRQLAASLAAGLLIALLGLSGIAVQSQRTARLEQERADSLQRAQTAELAKADQERAARADTYLQSAERSAMRGDWHQALDQLQRARDEGYADDVRLLVREAEAWMGLSDRARCNETLDRIDSLGGGGDLAGKVELLRGDFAMSEWRDSAEALSRLQHARELGLGPADSAYVDGLLSADSEEALERFAETLERDPFHHGALGAKAMLEVMLGRADSALSSAMTMAAIFPDDPGPPTVEAIVLASQGRFEDASALCNRISTKHGRDTALFSETCVEAYRTLAQLGPDRWYGHGGSLDPLVFAGLASKVYELAKAEGFGALNTAGPNLPSLRAAFGVVLPAILAPDSSAAMVENLEQAFESHPDGFIEYLRASKLLTLPEEGGLTKLDKMRWGAEAFGRAGRTPSFMTGMQRAARFWQLCCLEFVANRAPEPSIYDDLRPDLEYFLHLEPPSLEESCTLSRIAISAKTYDLARTFALSWQELAAPGDSAPERTLARIDVLDGRPATALQRLKALLQDAPDDGELRELREQAVGALKESLERFGG